MIAGVGGTFIKCHHDIRTEAPLDINRFFRREEMPGTINMGLKNDAILGEFPDIGQGLDLVPSAVGEDGFAPPVELMQPPGLFNRICSGAQIKMIGIP